jgi:hypothetical protein
MPKFPLDKCSVRYKRLTDGVQCESFARGDAMRMAVILIALMCAGAGAVPVDEAQRRLDQRRQQAATQPEQQQVEITRLRAQVARLVQELDALRAERDELVSALAAKSSTSKPAQNILNAIVEGRLEVGMTLAQANEAMGSDGRMVHKNEQGVETYEWRRATINAGGFGRGEQRGQDRIIAAHFAGGRLRSFASN